MISGEVKWFDNIKGFGFIKWSDEEDVLVHFSAIVDNKYKELKEGDKVKFLLAKSDKGLVAKKVIKI